MSSIPKPMFSKPISFAASVTVYPRPTNTDPLPDNFFDGLTGIKVQQVFLDERAMAKDDVFIIKPNRMPVYFGTRTARAWAKPWRQKKKHRKVAACQRRKEIKRLKGQAYGFPVFRCAVCDKAFVGGLTAKEARAQFETEFPGDRFEPDCMDVVCDPCFRKVGSEENRAEWAARDDNPNAVPPGDA